jgi:hypothetical protein
MSKFNRYGLQLSHYLHPVSSKTQDLCLDQHCWTTVGLCVSFFAYVFVSFELAYDTFNKKADRIYRVVADVETSQGTVFENSWGPLAAAIRSSCPEVQHATHFFLDYLIIQRESANASEEKIAYADSTLFSVFTLPLIRGNATNVLNAPGDIVLSESAAAKYFGDGDPEIAQPQPCQFQVTQDLCHPYWIDVLERFDFHNCFVFN